MTRTACGSARGRRARAGTRLAHAAAVAPALVVVLTAGLAVTGCDARGLETRTFEVRYLQPYVVEQLIGPYVYSDRDDRPGRMSASESAVTVRETPDNLDRIARVLEQYDRPRPTVMLNFQIIRADGSGDADPAIADVERELRRLFRFDGYELVAEAQAGGIQGTHLRQLLGEGERTFLIEAGVTEVRRSGDSPTVTLDVGLDARGAGQVLATTVTIPAGHSVVLGTARSPEDDGALILVVRADIVDAEPRPSSGS